MTLAYLLKQKRKTGLFKNFSVKMKRLFYLLLALPIISCQEKNYQKEDYLPLIKELHKIECEKLKTEGISFTINDTNIYSFRSIAFDKILTKNPDARLIAHYEDLNQKLASIEYWLDENQKAVYQEDFKEVY